MTTELMNTELMNTELTNTELKYTNRTLTVTRVFDAPREAVFEARIETSKVQKWWGCAQTTEVSSEVEPRVGGKYHHSMTLGAQGEIQMACRFTVYEWPSRLAYVDEGDDPNGQRVTVDFIEREGRTEVRLVHENLPEEYGEFVKDGWTAAMKKLAGVLTAELAA
jgi:uncharacterized protein YndB with AHSA1/START domain